MCVLIAMLLIVSSINNKLQQPEEAFGVLEYARKHHRADLVCLSRVYNLFNLVIVMVAVSRITV